MEKRLHGSLMMTYCSLVGTISAKHSLILSAFFKSKYPPNIRHRTELIEYQDISGRYILRPWSGGKYSKSLQINSWHWSQGIQRDVFDLTIGQLYYCYNIDKTYSEYAHAYAISFGAMIRREVLQIITSKQTTSTKNYGHPCLSKHWRGVQRRLLAVPWSFCKCPAVDFVAPWSPLDQESWLWGKR